MFDRISNSFALAKSSWQVLREHKQLVIFPILSGLACLLILISFWAPVVFGIGLERLADGAPPAWIYAVAFVYYFCTYFVVVFFNAALISCALMRFNGETPTLSDGLSAASMRLPQILAWALVSATIGMLLKLIENVHERVGQIISAILGTVWTVITYFVVPALVVEKLGPIDAIKRSASILKKTWGEALVGRIGLGFFKFLLALPGILLFILAVVLLTSQMTVLGLLLMACAVLYLLLEIAVGAALDGIFVGALYQFAANGTVPHGFDEDTMRDAFAKK